MKRAVPDARWIIVSTALVLIVCAPCLEGQQVRPFSLTDERDGLIEFLVRQKKDRRSNNLVAAWDAQELEFIERIGWGSGGYVYHPYFVSLRFFALLELHQDHYSGFSWDRRRDNKVLPQGRFDLTLLETHPYTFTFFGNRQETEIDRAFARSFPLMTETLGGSFNYKKGPLPFRMIIRHNRRRGYDAGSDISDRTEEIRAESQYAISDRSRGTLLGEWIDIWEDVQARRLVRMGFSTNNVSWFGADRRRQLTSNFRTSRQESLADTSSTSFSEAFGWRHTDSFSTNYRFRLDRNEIEAQTVNTVEGRAAVNHQLYESLTSRLDGFLINQDATQGTSKRFGGTLTESYSKGLTDWARLGLSLGLTSETLSRDRTQELAQVADEPHTLVDEQPAQLDNLDIEPASVIATDDRGAQVYFENEDYVLIVRGAIIEIVRLALGNIPDGGLVLVSYQYRLQPSSRVATHGGTGEARIALGNWLSLRTGLNRLNQSQEAGNPGVRLEALKRTYSDLRATWRWISAGVSYDNRESRISPQRSLAEHVTLSATSGRGWRYLFSARHQFSRYPDDNVHVRSVGFFGSLAMPLGFRGRLECEGQWRRDRWRGQPGFNDLDDRGVKVSLEWRLVDLILSGGGRLSRILRGPQIDDTSRLFVSIRREF